MPPLTVDADFGVEVGATLDERIGMATLGLNAYTAAPWPRGPQIVIGLRTWGSPKYPSPYTPWDRAAWTTSLRLGVELGRRQLPDRLRLGLAWAPKLRLLGLAQPEHRQWFLYDHNTPGLDVWAGVSLTLSDWRNEVLLVVTGSVPTAVSVGLEVRFRDVHVVKPAPPPSPSPSPAPPSPASPEAPSGPNEPPQ